MPSGIIVRGMSFKGLAAFVAGRGVIARVLYDSLCLLLSHFYPSSFFFPRFPISFQNDNPNTGQQSETLSRLTDVLTLKFVITDIPTWPFDTRIVGRLAAIILSVVAIILARVIAIALNI